MTKTRAGNYLAIISVLALSLFPLVTAQGHTVRDDSTVTIDHDNGRFHGEVKGDPPRCRNGRDVGLYKVLKNGERRFVDSASSGSDGTGTWSISKPNANGTFVAVVDRKASGGYGHSHICRADQSRELQVG